MTEPETPAAGSARRVFLEVVNGSTTKEAVEALLEQALNLTGLQYGHCPTCRKRVQVEVPDVKKRIDALIALLEQAEGKPDVGAAGVSVVVERPAWPHAVVEPE